MDEEDDLVRASLESAKNLGAPEVIIIPDCTPEILAEFKRLWADSYSAFKATVVPVIKE